MTEFVAANSVRTSADPGLMHLQTPLERVYIPRTAQVRKRLGMAGDEVG